MLSDALMIFGVLNFALSGSASRRSLLPASSLNFFSKPYSIVFDGQSTSTRSTAPSASKIRASP